MRRAGRFRVFPALESRGRARALVRALLAVVCIALAAGGGARAQEGLSGLARLDPGESRVADARRGLEIELALSQGVPWRVFTLTGPPRLVLDFREVDWAGVSRDGLMQAERAATGLRFGRFQPGWSRLIVDLAYPQVVESAALTVLPATRGARLSLRTRAADAERFAALSGAPRDPRWDLPAPRLPEAAARTAPRRPVGEGPLVVALDPGHGGVDPGAERDGVVEKDLLLQFAREVKEILLRAGGFEVVLTRDDDSFVSLERRVQAAHLAGAHVLISLHADTVSEGEAHGATLHVLSDSASDRATARLAERHNRADMLAGVDLSGRDDAVAGVLLDLARLETQPRAERLAQAILGGLQAVGAPLNSRPLRAGGFAVLKAADVPSVLFEIGFLSSDRDRANLTDPAWRTKIAWGLRDALRAWREDDAARAGLMRR